MWSPQDTFRPVRFFPTVLAVALVAVSAAAAPVPDKYAGLYQGLERILDLQLAQPPPVELGPPPLACADLLLANCNRGPALLHPATLDAVGPCLDRFRALGLGAVRIELHHPMLRPDFPRHAEYLEFYRQVVRRARDRGLKVMIHSTVLFADTPFSPFKKLYRGLDLDRFRHEYRSHVRIVLRQLQPDFLSLLTEPDTQARLTGLRELADPQVAAGVVDFVLAGTDRGRTLVGAGSGSWSSPAYARAFAATPVDFITIHVYPITGKFLGQAREMARIARAAGKLAFLDEAWLFKTLTPGDGGNNLSAAAATFRLDPYAFWAPLDAKFIDLTLKLAREENIGLVSYFWSSQFFAYLDYTRSLDWRRFAKVRELHGQTAWRAIQENRRSETGTHLETRLRADTLP